MIYCVGAIASWLVRSRPDRALGVQALDTGYCVVFLGKTLNSQFTEVYKWVPANVILGVALQYD